MASVLKEESRARAETNDAPIGRLKLLHEAPVLAVASRLCRIEFAQAVARIAVANT